MGASSTSGGVAAGLVDGRNSTSTPLAAGGVFTGDC